MSYVDQNINRAYIIIFDFTNLFYSRMKHIGILTLTEINIHNLKTLISRPN